MSSPFPLRSPAGLPPLQPILEHDFVSPLYRPLNERADSTSYFPADASSSTSLTPPRPSPAPPPPLPPRPLKARKSSRRPSFQHSTSSPSRPHHRQARSEPRSSVSALGDELNGEEEKRPRWKRSGTGTEGGPAGLRRYGSRAAHQSPSSHRPPFSSSSRSTTSALDALNEPYIPSHEDSLDPFPVRFYRSFHHSLATTAGSILPIYHHHTHHNEHSSRPESHVPLPAPSALVLSFGNVVGAASPEAARLRPVKSNGGDGRMAFYGREEEGERLGEEPGIVQGRRGLEDRVALTDVEKEAGRGERGKIARTAEKRRAENLKIVKELHILRHRSDKHEVRQFLVRLANALLIFGYPSHRIEDSLHRTAMILEIDFKVLFLPSTLIISFNGPEGSEMAILRASGGLDSDRLERIHEVMRSVLRDDISAREGNGVLKTITSEPPLHSPWMRIGIIGLCSMFGSAVAFDGSFLDLFPSFLLGSLMGLCQVKLVVLNPIMTSGFEIAMAFLVSFLARAFASSGHFCFDTLASAGIILILPGFMLVSGALEIAARTIVPGAVRLVYGTMLSLILGIGISLGSSLFIAMDSSQSTSSNYELSGSFTASRYNASSDYGMPNGTFTFFSSTESVVATGVLSCSRSEDWPWYQQAIPDIWNLLLIPCFILSLALWTKTRMASRSSSVAAIIAIASYVTYYFVKSRLPNQAEVSSAVGAFVIGLLGCLWSRLGHGTAFTVQSPAILLLVPNGLAAAGGIAMSTSDGQGAFDRGARIALRQIQTAIGITIGLFLANLLVYGFSRKRNGLMSW